METEAARQELDIATKTRERWSARSVWADVILLILSIATLSYGCEKVHVWDSDEAMIVRTDYFFVYAFVATISIVPLSAFFRYMTRRAEDAQMAAYTRWERAMRNDRE